MKACSICVASAGVQKKYDIMKQLLLNNTVSPYVILRLQDIIPPASCLPACLPDLINGYLSRQQVEIQPCNHNKEVFHYSLKEAPRKRHYKQKFKRIIVAIFWLFQDVGEEGPTAMEILLNFSSLNPFETLHPLLPQCFVYLPEFDISKAVESRTREFNLFESIRHRENVALLKLILQCRPEFKQTPFLNNKESKSDHYRSTEFVFKPYTLVELLSELCISKVLFEAALDSGVDINQGFTYGDGLLSTIKDDSTYRDEFMYGYIARMVWFVQKGLMDFRCNNRETYIMSLIKMIQSPTGFGKEKTCIGGIEVGIRTCETLGYQYRCNADFWKEESLMLNRVKYSIRTPNYFAIERDESVEAFDFGWARRNYNKTQNVRANLLEQHLYRLRNAPLSLCESCRNSIRLGIGGIHFQSKVDALPLPIRLKDFITLKDNIHVYKRMLQSITFSNINI